MVFMVTEDTASLPWSPPPVAKKTEPWPLLQDIVPAPRSPDTSKVLNFAAIVYKKRRESCSLQEIVSSG